MSQDFKLKFDEYKDNDPTHTPGEGGNPDYYPSGGNIRNLTFIWPNGMAQSFSYSYLVTPKLEPDGTSITFEFTSHFVEVKGINLSSLFFDILLQTPRFIRIKEKRYQQLEDNNKPVVNEITITEK